MAQKSQHHQKTRIVAVIALIIGVLGLGVAFAALGTTLKINGTAQIGSAKWDIRWENLNCTTTGEAEVNPAASISADFQTITINAKLVTPTDKITCDFEAANKGDLVAKLDSGSFASSVAGLATIKVDYTFKYRSTNGGATVGNNVGAADLDLPANQNHQMQLVLTNANTTLQGTASTVENFSFDLPYVQKNQ
ncbi:MAG: hypothetical protein LBQ02_02335 [Candidatus Nomurabacteria bacterium]|jgi:hypothetical protein|nr:hypothetical protein [Candidatus Nomurabacteria bacterium]